MAKYTVLACDLVSDDVIAELPVTELSYQAALSGAGTMSTTVPLGDPRFDGVALIQATVPGRTALYIERDGTIVWGGICWTRRYASVDGVLRLGGSEWPSYFSHRHIYQLYQATKDQALIFKDLVNFASRLGLAVTAPTTGVQQKVKWRAKERTSVAEAISALADPTYGFEFTSSASWAADGLSRERRLTLAYPRAGRTQATSEQVWEYPGAIAEYDWPEDATEAANIVVGIGAGDGNAALLKVAARPDMYTTERWPILERIVDYKDITYGPWLQALTDMEVGRRVLPVTTPTATLGPGVDYGTYHLGDEVRLDIRDLRFPNGMSTVKRIADISVAVDSSGVEVVHVALS